MGSSRRPPTARPATRPSRMLLRESNAADADRRLPSERPTLPPLLRARHTAARASAISSTQPASAIAASSAKLRGRLSQRRRERLSARVLPDALHAARDLRALGEAPELRGRGRPAMSRHGLLAGLAGALAELRALASGSRSSDASSLAFSVRNSSGCASIAPHGCAWAALPSSARAATASMLATKSRCSWCRMWVASNRFIACSSRAARSTLVGATGPPAMKRFT